MPFVGKGRRCQNRGVPQFPSMKAQEFERILARAPLEYTVARQTGSHRRLVAPNHPPLTFSYHKGATIPPGVVRKILVKDVGLTEEQALTILGVERRGDGSR